MQTISTQTRIGELESIRGLAALLVLFHHIPKWNPILDSKIINNGYVMVDLFFVLSGFVIFNAYSNKINNKFEFLRFQFLRFGRLYPVHITFLFIYVLIEIAKYYAQIKLGIQSHNTQPFRENSLVALIQQVFLLQAVGPTGNGDTFNTPAWSISVEFYTYFVFGVSILFLKSSRILVYSLLVVACLLLLASKLTFGSEKLLRCFAGFFIGCLTARATEKIKFTFHSSIALATLVLIILFLQFKNPKELDIGIYFLTAVLIASLVLSRQGILKKILNLKALNWLGTMSYSIYMTHFLILWTINQIIRVVLKRPDIPAANGFSAAQLSIFETLLACGVLIGTVIIASLFVFNFIEKPFREKSRQALKILETERWRSEDF